MHQATAADTQLTITLADWFLFRQCYLWTKPPALELQWWFCLWKYEQQTRLCSHLPELFKLAERFIVHVQPHGIILITHPSLLLSALE